MGKCTQCGSWNTIEEQVIEQRSRSLSQTAQVSLKEPIKLNMVKREKHERQLTKIGEFDRVLGGGLMPGSVVLIGGEPGIGKSTLLLQLALKNKQWKTLYVAGEESEAQIKDRADRLGVAHENILITTQLVVEDLCQLFQKIKPDIVIVDSIQAIQSRNLESIPGTISQIRESAYQLINSAKYLNFPLIRLVMYKNSMHQRHLVDTFCSRGQSNSGLRI